MQSIQVITIKQNELWDSIIRSFKNHDVYYLSSYTKAFQIHGDGEPILFYYEDQNLKAMNVVMKRDISLEKEFNDKLPMEAYYDVTTPYGYGGFLIEGTITEEGLRTLNDKYIALCKDNGIISEFVRFHPILNNIYNLENIYDISTLGKTITMNLTSEELIWDELTSKNRNVIRKARKFGVEIYWGRSEELYTEFIGLYNATMDKDNATDYYYFEKDFYKSLLHDLKYNSLMFYAVYEGQIIAMSIILYANQQMHYHLSASDRKYQYLAPTNLLLFEASCWGCENGFKTFHLGGGLASKEDNLFKFKKAFNKHSNSHFSIGRKIFNQEKYDELLSIRRENSGFIAESEFFPKYRANENSIL